MGMRKENLPTIDVPIIELSQVYSVEFQKRIFNSSDAKAFCRLKSVIEHYREVLEKHKDTSGTSGKGYELKRLSKLLHSLEKQLNAFNPNAHDFFEPREQVVQIEAPKNRIPIPSKKMPHFLARRYSKAKKKFYFQNQGQPFSYWAGEIIELGDGLFIVGEVHKPDLVIEKARVYLRSPNSKTKVFWDLLCQMQRLFDSNSLTKLPPIEIANKLRRSSIIAFVGVDRSSRIFIAVRESLSKPFGYHLLQAQYSEVHPVLLDMLASLQWGFRLLDKKFQLNDNWEFNMDLPLKKLRMEEVETLIPMRDFLSASSKKHLKYLLGTKKIKLNSIYDSNSELRRAFLKK